MKKLTQSEFIEKAKNIHKNKYNYSKSVYINKRTKICIICPKHGEFWQTPDVHLNSKCGCPLCGKETTKAKTSYTTLCFIDKAKEIHGDLYDYSKVNYVNNLSPIKIICKKHGEFTQKPASHLIGSGCPKCAIEAKARKISSSKEEFIKKANQVHSFKYGYNKVNYINNRTKITITCPVHGDFEQTPHSHLSGKGCPHCKVWKTQEKIFNALKLNFPNENWIWEYKPEWLKPQSVDIFNERVHLAIEYNGEQHYIPVKRFGGTIGHNKCVQRDNKKKDILNKHGCILYTIAYNEFNLEKIINDIKTFLNYENC